MEPSRPTAMLLLGAVLSDTVILNSPTTTERDRAVVDYFERSLGLDAARVRPRDVRGHLRHLRASPPRTSSRATPSTTRPTTARRCASRRSRRSATASSSAATSCSTAMDARARAPRLRLLRADGHRHHRQGHRAARVAARRRASSARSASADARRRDRPARRHEPQEAARAEAARGLLNAFAFGDVFTPTSSMPHRVSAVAFG